MLFGTPLALGSWLGLIVLILYVFGLVLRILEEQKFLFKNLPGYDEYCKKVRYRLKLSENSTAKPICCMSLAISESLSN